MRRFDLTITVQVWLQTLQVRGDHEFLRETAILQNFLHVTKIPRVRVHVRVASRGNGDFIPAAEVQHGQKILPGAFPEAFRMEGRIVDFQKGMTPDDWLYKPVSVLD